MVDIMDDDYESDAEKFLRLLSVEARVYFLSTRDTSCGRLCIWYSGNVFCVVIVTPNRW